MGRLATIPGADPFPKSTPLIGRLAVSAHDAIKFAASAVAFYWKLRQLVSQASGCPGLMSIPRSVIGNARSICSLRAGGPTYDWQ